MTTFDFAGLVDRFEQACADIQRDGLTDQTYEQYRDARRAVIAAFDETKNPVSVGR